MGKEAKGVLSKPMVASNKGSMGLSSREEPIHIHKEPIPKLVQFKVTEIKVMGQECFRACASCTIKVLAENKTKAASWCCDPGATPEAALLHV